MCTGYLNSKAKYEISSSSEIIVKISFYIKMKRMCSVYILDIFHSLAFDVKYPKFILFIYPTRIDFVVFLCFHFYFFTSSEEHLLG